MAYNKRKLLPVHCLNDNGDILLEQSYKNTAYKLRHRSEYGESDISTCMFYFRTEINY